METWKQIHTQLQGVLFKEIALCREILGNLSQQEYVLLIGDIELRSELEVECQKFISQLKEISQESSLLVRKLFDHLPANTVGKTLEEILDPLVDSEEETLLLHKQAMGLNDKIEEQRLRNKTLHGMILKEGPLAIDNPSLHAEAVKGKKSTLITIDYPEEKQES